MGGEGQGEPTEAHRCRWTTTPVWCTSIDTFYNDVDINGHINSVKYIEHVLDLFPLDWYKEHPLKRFDIAYVAEAHQGDRLNFYREEDADEELCYKIPITKTVAGSGDKWRAAGQS